MIISTERWSVLVVLCWLLVTAMGRGGHDHQDTMTISQEAGKSSEIFPTIWNNFPTTMNLDKNYTFSFTVMDEGFPSIPKLVLCYAEAPQTDGLSDSNTWSVIAGIIYTCPQIPGSTDQNCTLTSNATIPGDINVGFSPMISASDFTKYDYQNNSTNSFFFCFTVDDLKSGDTRLKCSSYSPFFGIEAAIPASVPTKVPRQEPPTVPSITQSKSTTQTAAATTALEVTNVLSILSIFGSPPTSLPSSSSTKASYTSYATTITTTPTSPPTSVSDSISASATSSPASYHSSSLLLGAKVGIALGVIIFVFLILFFIILLLRRRRKNLPASPSRTPENPLLSSLKNNDSRDLFVAEKLGLTDRTNTNTPLTFLGAGMGIGGAEAGAYEQEDDLTADLPAPGSAFTANIPVAISPRRSQVVNTLRSERIDRRGISMASGVSRPVSFVNGDIGASSTPANTGDLSRETTRERIGERSILGRESHTDNFSAAGIDAGAINTNAGRNEGTTRNTLDIDSPKVYKGTLQAPFLSEPGMSPEEVARLEEEERRIDEAIAEAEEERRTRAREARGS